ncbi:hypothetical protein [Shimazuella alba]|uniref:Tetratricopeptide repeat protein n=1 Tax=Shimazuella alba TaxID=2690964 RepID=A0A6I4VTH1_9BACL|nr:hypothetical protein [Shimazuella alba]MXQ53465.1 hypothetical protein [Shimazuella alba]
MSDEQNLPLAILLYLLERAEQDVEPSSPSYERLKRASIELEDVLPFADSEPEKAHRAAELLEILDRPDEALAYWHRAAALGNQDAVDMVEILHIDIQ